MKAYDVIVIGAGPAGLAAAESAAQYGAHVLAIDSNEGPGGQLIKQIHKFFGSAKVCAGIRGIRLADRFYHFALEKGCEFLFNSAVYALNPEPDGEYRVFAADGQKTRCFTAKAIVLALGASENGLAFPGWTKPGVITAGAAQTMVNASRVRFGERVLMVGAGNVGLIVSYQLMQSGIDIAAVIEAAPRIGGYAVHANKIQRAGIPIYTSCTILKALGEDQVTGAVIADVDQDFQLIPGTERTLDVDTICLAVGLSPLVKLAAAARLKLVKNSTKNETIPWHDDRMMTSLPGVFVAGDVSGVEEASIALEEGSITGAAAADYLGLAKDTVEDTLSMHRQRLEELRQHGTDKEPSYDISRYRDYKGAKAVIECFEGIPCNPCEHFCAVGAIHVGERITNTPAVDLDKCTGCGKCVVTCPGLACFLLNWNYSATEAEVSFPYEYLPAPAEGSTQKGLSRMGEYLCDVRVTKIRRLKDNDHTLLMSVAVPKEYAQMVRAIDRKGAPA